MPVAVWVAVDVMVVVAVTVLDAVAVEVDVAVPVGVRVPVAVALAVDVGVAVAVSVAVLVAVVVADAVGVGVGVAVRDALVVGVAVAVGVAVLVAVNDVVAVAVAVRDAVCVAVAVRDAVAVAVGVTVGVDPVAVAEAVGVGPVNGTIGLSKRSTRLLVASATYRLPTESSATPFGWHIAVALGAGSPGAESAHKLAVKSVPLAPCPRTRSAVTSPAPLAGLSGASGWLYSSTRLLTASATNRFPVLSRLMPNGWHMSVALGSGSPFPAELAHATVVKLVPLLPWPKTRSAVVSPRRSLD